jgi:predicted ATPase
MTEAVAQLNNGLKVLRGLPETLERDRREFDLCLALGNASAAGRGTGAPETHSAYARAVELSQQSGDESRLFGAWYGLIRVHFSRAELIPALELADQVLATTCQRADVSAQLMGHFAVRWVSLALGRLGSAETHLAKALAFDDPEMERSLLASCGVELRALSLAYLSWTCLALGHIDRARGLSRQALTEAERLSHALTLAVVLDRILTVAEFCRDHVAASKMAVALSNLGKKQAFPAYVAKAEFDLGWLMVDVEDIRAGITRMRGALAVLQANADEDFMPHYLLLLATAHARAEEFAEALSLVRGALARLEGTGERLFEAELHRLEGKLLVSSDWPGAEGCFRKAIAVAQAQQARLWELRAATSLARLWAEQGRRAEAHDLLAPVYGWFTEGFDTADLKDAKALLDELR